MRMGPHSLGSVYRHPLLRSLKSAGVAGVGYSSHSFHFSAATAAAKTGVSDSLIQTLGRWKSSAFTAYIRTRCIATYG